MVIEHVETVELVSVYVVDVQESRETDLAAVYTYLVNAQGD